MKLAVYVHVHLKQKFLLFPTSIYLENLQCEELLGFVGIKEFKQNIEGNT